MQQMVGQNWLLVAALNFTQAGWLAGWLAAVADSQSWKDHILLSCVVADLISDDTRFRVPLSPSLSLSNLLMVVNPAKIDADHCCSWMPRLLTCSCYSSY
jgi:hypothetical protein